MRESCLVCGHGDVFFRGAVMVEGKRPTDEGVLQLRLKNFDTLKSLPSVLSHLDEAERNELVSLINKYPALFSDTSSQTHLIEHHIEVGDAHPIKQRFSRVLQLVGHNWTERFSIC